MRKSEPVARGGALMALLVCAIKGLLTTIVFIALPHTGGQQHSHFSSYAHAQQMIDAQLARASAARAIIHVAKSGVSAETKEVGQSAPPEPFAAMPAHDPEIAWELAYLVGSEDPNEKAPPLLSLPPPPRAPPGARHVLPPDYAHYPQPRVGLSIAWATPPPLFA